jgi:protein involved in temperature-dependent protein secretion
MTRLPYWPSIREFQLEQPIRARDLAWAAVLLSIAKGKAHDVQNWRELRTRFHVTVTGKIDVACDFLCSELEPDDPFPLDRQWICATNKPMNQVNHNLQE